MSGYRQNAKEEKATMAAEERYWTRTRKLAYTIGSVGVIFILTMAVAYRIVSAPRPVTPPKAKCVDSAKVIGTNTGNMDHECDEGARVDTTRIRSGENTQVIVRCTCLDHAPSMDDAGQP